MGQIALKMGKHVSALVCEQTGLYIDMFQSSQEPILGVLRILLLNFENHCTAVTILLLLQDLAIASEFILAILAVVAALVSIWVSVICCQAVGCCAPSQNVSIRFATQHTKLNLNFDKTTATIVRRIEFSETQLKGSIIFGFILDFRAPLTLDLLYDIVV